MRETTESPPGKADQPEQCGKRSVREWLVRLTLMLAGLFVAHLGVTLFLLPALGADPFTVFAQGGSVASGVRIGTCHACIQIVLLALYLWKARQFVLPGTVVCTFCGGPIIDLYYWLLAGYVSSASAMPIRIASMLAGCIVLAVGMALVIKSDAGTGANDLVAVILTDRLKRFQFRWVRMACDIFFVAIGYLLGGVAGLGTVAAAAIVGPVAQYFFPVMERLTARCTASFSPPRSADSA